MSNRILASLRGLTLGTEALTEKPSQEGADGLLT